jgi:glycosyltransferase involved in cell wall biosynthesis
LEEAKKNLLIVVNYYDPYISGVSEYAKFVAESMTQDYNVTVLTGMHRDDLLKEENFDGYKVKRATPNLFLDKGYVSLEFISLFRVLQKKADIVNLHFPMLESGLFSFMTTKPIVLTYQCDMALVGNIFSRIAVCAVRLSGWIALMRAKKVVVLSYDYANNSTFLRPQLKKTLAIFPPNRLESHLVTKEYEHFNVEGKFVIGFVGRFVEEKGIAVLLEAFINLDRDDVELWLAGDFENVAGGTVYQTLREKIELLGQRVKLLGSQTDEELVSFYSAIDVLALPSTNRFEAFGMVQLEAMSFGAIPVSSDLPGVREVIKRTEIGHLVTPGSVKSLEQGLRLALRDRTRISRETIKASLYGFHRNKNLVDSYLEIFNSAQITDSSNHG